MIAMAAIGIYGGTFDPVHAGHIKVAERAYAQLELEKMLLIPANNPWLKEGTPITRFQHRYRMLEIAVEGRLGLEVSDVEGRRDGPTYTFDTVKQLQLEYPGRDLVLVAGGDSVETMPRWHRVKELLSLCRVMVYRRSTDTTGDIELIIANLGGEMKWIEGPNLEISATEIRTLIATGRNPQEKMPIGVYNYISKKGLYADTVSS